MTVMGRFVQLHLLTFYPPANVNRDDTGRPKTAIIGGAERLRISSQSLKRAIRTSDVFKAKLGGHLAKRTQRLGADILKHLVDKGMEEKRALVTARKIAEVFGKLEDEKSDNPSYIRQLAFISPEERKAAFALADQALAGGTIDSQPDAILAKVDTAADIAMFGRMLADNADFNREAAVQVAHAYTTHRATVEDDFYTAIDDLKTKAEDAGAGFVGELGFGSGLFYLYVCIDTLLLVANLSGNGGIAKSAVAALMEAVVTVSPGGKQASFASRARAEYLLVEMGSQQPRTLGSAFAKPVAGADLVAASVAKLKTFQQDMDKAYGACADGRYTMEVGVEGTLTEAIGMATKW
jgi:CRISPR system Cascade subunit CasC